MLRIITALLAATATLHAARTFDGSTNNLFRSSAVLTAEPITIAVWAKPSANTAAYLPVSITSSSAAAIWFAIELRGDMAGKDVRARVLTGGSPASVTATASAGFVSGSWQHVAAVFENTSSRAVYLDGGSKGTDTTTRASFSGTIDRTVIASGYNSGSAINYFPGDLAEVAIWSVALTDDDVAALAKGFSPLLVRPSALVWYVPLVRDIADIRTGVALSGSTTSAADHPRIYR